MLKKHIKYFFAIISFLLIFVILLIVSSAIFAPKNNTADFGMTNVTANGILGEVENSIDIIVLGDSEAYSSISPMEIWNEYSITSYVCSTSAQYISYSEVLLEQALQRQSPKIVILETNNIYRDMRYENSIITEMESVFSVFKYHDRWKSIKLRDFKSSAEYTWTDDNKGYIRRNEIVPSNDTNYMDYTDERKSIPLLNAEYVKSIASKCKQNNIKFILLSTPSTKNWSMKKHNGIEKLAQELDIEYIDLNLMNDSIKIDWNKDTYDKGDHLNYSGAKKVSEFLGDYLTNEIEFQGDYTDIVCEKWDEAYTRYFKTIQ